MRNVVIAGADMTRFGKFPERGVRSLAEEATREALRDAGASPNDVGMVFFANAVAGLITGQEMIQGQVALRNTGLLGTPIINVENACASASTASNLAWLAVASPPGRPRSRRTKPTRWLGSVPKTSTWRSCTTPLPRS